MEKTLENNVICQFRRLSNVLENLNYLGGFTQTYEVTVGGSEPVGESDKKITEILETEMLATTKEYCGWECLKESECDSFAFGDSGGEVGVFCVSQKNILFSESVPPLHAEGCKSERNV